MSTSVDPYAATHKTDIADGTYTLTSANLTTAAIDAQNAGLTSGTLLQLYTANSSAAQRWVVSHVGNYVTITNASSGLAVDVADGTAADGTSVRLWEYNGSDAQKWVAYKVSDGTYEFRSAVNWGYALDATGGATSNGTLLELWSANSTGAQRWVATKLELADTSISTLKKRISAADAAMTKGARYGLYSDEACTDLLEEVEGDGSALVGRLTKAWCGFDYYVKELAAPDGCLLDTSVYKVRTPAYYSTANFDVDLSDWPKPATGTRVHFMLASPYFYGDDRTVPSSWKEEELCFADVPYDSSLTLDSKAIRTAEAALAASLGSDESIGGCVRWVPGTPGDATRPSSLDTLDGAWATLSTSLKVAQETWLWACWPWHKLHVRVHNEADDSVTIIFDGRREHLVRDTYSFRSSILIRFYKAGLIATTSTAVLKGTWVRRDSAQPDFSSSTAPLPPLITGETWVWFNLKATTVHFMFEKYDTTSVELTSTKVPMGSPLVPPTDSSSELCEPAAVASRSIVELLGLETDKYLHKWYYPKTSDGSGSTFDSSALTEFTTVIPTTGLTDVYLWCYTNYATIAYYVDGTTSACIPTLADGTKAQYTAIPYGSRWTTPDAIAAAASRAHCTPGFCGWYSSSSAPALASDAPLAADSAEIAKQKDTSSFLVKKSAYRFFGVNRATVSFAYAKSSYKPAVVSDEWQVDRDEAAARADVSLPASQVMKCKVTHTLPSRSRAYLSLGDGRWRTAAPAAWFSNSSATGTTSSKISLTQDRVRYIKWTLGLAEGVVDKRS